MQSDAKLITSASRSTAQRSSASFHKLLWIPRLHSCPNPSSSHTRSLCAPPCSLLLRCNLNDNVPLLLITTFERLLFFLTQPLLRLETDLPYLKTIPITDPLLVELKYHRATRQLPQCRRRSAISLARPDLLFFLQREL